jgi:fibrillarin-like rRNA methylase
MPEIYQQIADKDTFEIFIRNLKEFLVPDTTTVQKKKKKKPEEL